MTQRRSILTALALCGLAASAQPALPTFEVGTVKVSQPTSSGPFSIVPVYPSVRNGVFQARFMPLKTLLAFAYDVSEVQISGPDWLAKNLYDINARVPEATQQRDARQMLRAFLTERLKLVTHSTTQDMDALALVVEKKGIKLHSLTPGEAYNIESPKGNGSLILSRGNMRAWADLLTRVMGAPVIDQTGLAGAYAGAVMYTSYERAAAGPSDFPTFPTALKEQAGLELIKRVMKVNVIVVDQANETPEAN